LSADEKVVLITINTNAVNCINESFLSDCNTCFDQLESDPRLKAKPVVFRSPDNSRTFSAGMDVKVASQSSRSNESKIKQFISTFQATLQRILTYPTRTVAAISGHCLAGGLFFVLACDVRLAWRGNYLFGLTEVEIGFGFPALMYELAKAKLPAPTIWESFLKGNKFGPAEAARKGLVDRLVEDKGSLVQEAINEAACLHTACREAYAALKMRLLKPILDTVQRTNDELLDEVLRIQFTEGSQRSLNRINHSLLRSTKSNL